MVPEKKWVEFVVKETQKGMVVNPLKTVPFWVGLPQWQAPQTDREVEGILADPNRDCLSDSWIQGGVGFGVSYRHRSRKKSAKKNVG